MAFHEILFPTVISRGSQGGPGRKTDIVTLSSGFEERNSRWADSRRSYNAGYGVKTLDELHAILAFFEERRGQLHGFRWRDHADCKSCAPDRTPSALDQPIGIGDGVKAVFQLSKTYGASYAPWMRTIKKPVTGSVAVAVGGVIKSPGTYSVQTTSGLVSFVPAHVPASGLSITAGFIFDVPVRFDTDKLEVSLSGFHHGAIPNIPILEIRL